MKYLFRSWLRRLFSTGSAQTIRRSTALQLEALEDRTTPSFVGVKLIKDIVAGAGASNPNYFTEVNGIVYFAATDASGDRELWRTDGTAAGTYQVTNIHPSGSSNPQNLINVNGTLFFVADHPTYGRELWKSDGTAAGTILVKDIRPFSYSSDPRSLTSLNGTLFFSANNGNHGYELWKSDGTELGTIMVMDIKSGSSGSYPYKLTAMNGTLFFRADDWTYGRELWRSDGTVVGTVMVKDINPGSSNSSPEYLTHVNGTLFFAANDGTHGWELWRSDGTAAGTVLVKDISSGSTAGIEFTPSWRALPLTNVNGKLFFAANDGIHGRELWRSDGTEGGTVLVKDIRSGSNGSYLAFLTNVNGALFFAADDGTHSYGLWKSNGTETGTVLVKDVNIPSPISWPSLPFAHVNGTLFFVANDGTYGWELWLSDGTASGTQLVTDINPNSSSAPRNLTNVNGTLFFTANDGTHGYELWRTAVATTLTITSGNNQSTTVGTAFSSPLVVQVLDQFGEPMAGVPVTLTAPGSGASATLSTSTATTGSNGQAQVTAMANTIAGSYTVTASVGSLSANFNLRNTPGPAVLQIVSGNNQSTTVNTAFANPLVVEVLDQFNNPLPNVNVTFTAPSSGASALFGGNSSITVTTDANGQASVNIDANTSAGSYAVTASVGSLSANFNLTNNADAPFSLQIVGTSSQSTTVNTAFASPLVVEVRDQYGNPVPNVNVTFVAPSSGASALFGGNSSITVTTDSNGQAQVTATANTVAGSYQVQVTSGSLTGVQFSLTNNPDALSQLAFSIQPPTAVSVGQRFRVQVQLRDRYGNAVRLPNVAIRLSLRAGSGLSGTLVKRTNTIGLATFSDLVLSTPGRYRLMARAGSFQVISRVILVS